MYLKSRSALKLNPYTRELPLDSDIKLTALLYINLDFVMIILGSFLDVTHTTQHLLLPLLKF